MMNINSLELHFENLEFANVNGDFVEELEYTINKHGEVDFLKLKLSRGADTTCHDLYSDTQTLFQRLEYNNNIVSLSFSKNGEHQGGNVKWDECPYNPDTNVLQQSYRNEEDGSMMVVINEPVQNLKAYSGQLVDAVADALNLPVILRKIADKLDSKVK